VRAWTRKEVERPESNHCHQQHGADFSVISVKPCSSLPALRVEFLLKTDSEYSRDAGVTLVRSQSPVTVSCNSNIDTRMDTPQSVIKVIRAVA